MTYLDGELSAERAPAAARHLEQCRDCQRLVTDFQNLSQTLLGWEIEFVPSALPAGTPEAKQKWNFGVWQRPSLATAGALSVLFLISLIGLILAPPRHATKTASSQVDLSQAPAPDSAGAQRTGHVDGSPIAGAPSSGPLIVRTAQLALTSNHLDQTKADVERIAGLHHGYVAQLEFNSPAGAARTLNATLQVPATQVNALLPELRQLGHLDEESQHGENVTQHYVDVNARLANLRTTEERLLQILREHTGKLADVLQVEEAVGRTRGQIEMTEAEQKNLSGQIAFASVNVRVTDEYKGAAARSMASASARLRNAAADGYRSLVERTLGVLEFLLSTGPVLLLLFAVAFFPARWLWRLRSRSAS